MSSEQQNILKNLVESSNKINSKVFNLTRFLILSTTSYIRDGIQYRELKTLLNISDGKLKANLDALQEMCYINKIKVQVDQKLMHIYRITESGNKELQKVIKLIKLFNEK